MNKRKYSTTERDAIIRAFKSRTISVRPFTLAIGGLIEAALPL